MQSGQASQNIVIVGLPAYGVDDGLDLLTREVEADKILDSLLSPRCVHAPWDHVPVQLDVRHYHTQ